MFFIVLKTRRLKKKLLLFGHEMCPALSCDRIRLIFGKLLARSDQKRPVFIEINKYRAELLGTKFYEYPSCIFRVLTHGQSDRQTDMLRDNRWSYSVLTFVY